MPSDLDQAQRAAVRQLLLTNPNPPTPQPRPPAAFDLWVRARARHRRHRRGGSGGGGPPSPGGACGGGLDGACYAPAPACSAVNVEDEKELDASTHKEGLLEFKWAALGVG